MRTRAICDHVPKWVLFLLTPNFLILNMKLARELLAVFAWKSSQREQAEKPKGDQLIGSAENLSCDDVKLHG